MSPPLPIRILDGSVEPGKWPAGDPGRRGAKCSFSAVFAISRRRVASWTLRRVGLAFKSERAVEHRSHEGGDRPQPGARCERLHVPCRERKFRELGKLIIRRDPSP
jgi:hypothetical protein